MSKLQDAIDVHTAARLRFHAASIRNIYGLTSAEQLDASRDYHEADVALQIATAKLDRAKEQAVKDAPPPPPQENEK